MNITYKMPISYLIKNTGIFNNTKTKSEICMCIIVRAISNNVWFLLSTIPFCYGVSAVFKWLVMPLFSHYSFNVLDKYFPQWLVWKFSMFHPFNYMTRLGKRPKQPSASDIQRIILRIIMRDNIIIRST